MRLRLAAILLALCALIGAPQSAMARAVSNEKTASGVFAVTDHPHARPEPLQVPDRVPETTPRGCEPAPGRPKWISRDPIEEEGGINLYEMCSNDGVNKTDFLGKSTNDTSPSPNSNSRLKFAKFNNKFEIDQVSTALLNSIVYSTEGVSHLNSLSFNALSKRYLKWFGCSTKKDFEKVRKNFLKIDEALKNSKITFVYSRGDYYGAAIPGWGKRIWIGKDFWSAPMTGENSKAGTILHEMSHEVGKTNDHAYGTGLCLQLALKTPKKAADNADNYEFFVEVK